MRTMPCIRYRVIALLLVPNLLSEPGVRAWAPIESPRARPSGQAAFVQEALAPALAASAFVGIWGLQHSQAFVFLLHHLPTFYHSGIGLVLAAPAFPRPWIHPKEKSLISPDQLSIKLASDLGDLILSYSRFAEADSPSVSSFQSQIEDFNRENYQAPISQSRDFRIRPSPDKPLIFSRFNSKGPYRVSFEKRPGRPATVYFTSPEEIVVYTIDNYVKSLSVPSFGFARATCIGRAIDRNNLEISWTLGDIVRDSLALSDGQSGTAGMNQLRETISRFNALRASIRPLENGQYFVVPNPNQSLLINLGRPAERYEATVQWERGWGLRIYMQRPGLTRAYDLGPLAQDVPGSPVERQYVARMRRILNDDPLQPESRTPMNTVENLAKRVSDQPSGNLPSDLGHLILSYLILDERNSSALSSLQAQIDAFNRRSYEALISKNRDFRLSPSLHKALVFSHFNSKAPHRVSFELSPGRPPTITFTSPEEIVVYAIGKSAKTDPSYGFVRAVCLGRAIDLDQLEISGALGEIIRDSLALQVDEPDAVWLKLLNKKIDRFNARHASIRPFENGNYFVVPNPNQSLYMKLGSPAQLYEATVHWETGRGLVLSMQHSGLTRTYSLGRLAHTIPAPLIEMQYAAHLFTHKERRLMTRFTQTDAQLDLAHLILESLTMNSKDPDVVRSFLRRIDTFNDRNYQEPVYGSAYRVSPLPGQALAFRGLPTDHYRLSFDWSPGHPAIASFTSPEETLTYLVGNFGEALSDRTIYIRTATLVRREADLERSEMDIALGDIIRRSLELRDQKQLNEKISRFNARQYVVPSSASRFYRVSPAPEKFLFFDLGRSRREPLILTAQWDKRQGLRIFMQRGEFANVFSVEEYAKISSTPRVRVAFATPQIQPRKGPIKLVPLGDFVLNTQGTEEDPLKNVLAGQIRKRLLSSFDPQYIGRLMTLGELVFEGQTLEEALDTLADTSHEKERLKNSWSELQGLLQPFTRSGAGPSASRYANLSILITAGLALAGLYGMFHGASSIALAATLLIPRIPRVFETRARPGAAGRKMLQYAA